MSWHSRSATSGAATTIITGFSRRSSAATHGGRKMPMRDHVASVKSSLVRSLSSPAAIREALRRA